LVQWRTIVNLEGCLQIVREVLRGPLPLSNFDLKGNKR
jgi:hypothetical protein